MELIEKQKAMDCCFKPQVRPNEEIFNALKMAIRSEISALQSVDAAPVVHGRWIENQGYDDDYYYTCSVCKCDWTTIDGTPTENNMRYCPECGAKMDLEEQHDD